MIFQSSNMSNSQAIKLQQSNQNPSNIYSSTCNQNYDQFQLIKNKKNFTVAIRIKPQLNSNPSNQISINLKKLSNNTQQLKISTSDINNYQYSLNNSKKFVFDKIFQTQTSNYHIFSSLIQKKLSLLQKSVNLSIMAYGATNSGKTYTIFGKKQDNIQSSSLNGLSYLTFRKVFQMFQENYYISFSFVQIYNQNVFDLLNSYNSNNILNVMQDSQGNTNVIGITRKQINTIQQLQKFIIQGNIARVSSNNTHNFNSSRSHAFMQMQIKHKRTKQKNKIVIVDLAGSERYIYNSSNTTVNGSNILKQGSNINKSLLSLGNCIKSLFQNDQHIPYRDSKLTRLLKQNLSGYSHNIMIACINKNINNLEQNLNSLNYASKAMKIQKQIIRKFQNEQLSQFQCSYCKQKLPYCLIKQIRKHQIYKQRVKTRQSQSLSASPIAKNKEQIFGFKSKYSSNFKANYKKIQLLIQQNFQLLVKLVSEKQTNKLDELKNIIFQCRDNIKNQFKQKIFKSLRKNQEIQEKRDKSLIVSQFDQNSFQNIKQQKSINKSFIKTNLNITERKIKISLSKPRKHLERTASTFQNSQVNIKKPQIYKDSKQQCSRNIVKFSPQSNHIKIEDQSIENESQIYSFRSNLTVEIMDDRQKVQKERKEVLQQMSSNQRKNPSLEITKILKFKSAQNSLKSKNINSFIYSQISNNTSKIIQNQNKQNKIRIQNRQTDDHHIQPFDSFIINQRLLDSTTVAPRMKRDIQQLGVWKNIVIKQIDSPSNFEFNSEINSGQVSCQQSFVQEKIQIKPRKQAQFKRVFRY